MARDKSAHHEKIIAAAREEFMTYGFTDASMRRIAAAAGMSVAGLYKHFTGKEEMFAALVEPACQGLMDMYRQEETAERVAAHDGSLTGKWEQGGEARLAMTYIYDHLDAFRLLICKSAGTRYESFLHDLAVAVIHYLVAGIGQKLIGIVDGDVGIKGDGVGDELGDLRPVTV